MRSTAEYRQFVHERIQLRGFTVGRSFAVLQG